MQLHILDPHVENVPHGPQLQITQHSRDALCDCSCQRYTGNTHVLYQQQVKAHIESGGYQQETQGGNRVTETAQNAGEHIVEEETYNADKIDIQILGAPFKNGIGSFQHGEHRPGDQRADDHDGKGSKGGKGNAVADGKGKPLPILGAEALRDHNARTCGYTHKQCQQQVENGHGGTDCGQRQVALVDTDNDRIGGIVELLGKVAQKHGNGKFQYSFPWGAKGHILGREQFFQFHRYMHPRSFSSFSHSIIEEKREKSNKKPPCKDGK